MLPKVWPSSCCSDMPVRPYCVTNKLLRSRTAGHDGLRGDTGDSPAVAVTTGRSVMVLQITLQQGYNGMMLLSAKAPIAWRNMSHIPAGVPKAWLTSRVDLLRYTDALPADTCYSISPADDSGHSHSKGYQVLQQQALTAAAALCL